MHVDRYTFVKTHLKSFASCHLNDSTLLSFSNRFFLFFVGFFLQLKSYQRLDPRWSNIVTLQWIAEKISWKSRMVVLSFSWVRHLSALLFELLHSILQSQLHYHSYVSIIYRCYELGLFLAPLALLMWCWWWDRSNLTCDTLAIYHKWLWLVTNNTREDSSDQSIFQHYTSSG